MHAIVIAIPSVCLSLVIHAKTAQDIEIRFALGLSDNSVREFFVVIGLRVDPKQLC